jgi:formylmethanofuran dehydrogenase subunit D
MTISNLKINSVTAGATGGKDFAGHAPMVVTGETDRHPYTAGVRQAGAVGSIENNGGKLQVNFSPSGVPFAAKDTVLLTGLKGTASKFNGRHQVDTSGPTTVIVNTAWVASSATAGTITRLNDGLIVRMDMEVGTANIGTVDARVGEGGAFQADVSGVIAANFVSIFDISGAGGDKVNASNFVRDTVIRVAEVYQDATLAATVQGATALPEVRAHATVTLDNLLPGRQVCEHQKVLKVNRSFFWHAIGNDGDTMSLNFDTGLPIIYPATSPSDHHALAYDMSGLSPGAKVVVKYYKNATGLPEYKDETVYIKAPACGKCLYFLNRLGGYTPMVVVKYEDKTVTEKIDRYTVDSHIERTLFSPLEAESAGEYLKDLINSPEVYDENSQRVYVIDTQLIYRAEQVQAVVTIKIEQNWIR